MEFIQANTIELPLEEIESNHIIPVFNRDNTPLISQAQFIETTYDVIKENRVEGPFIRVSHPVKGRIPSARNKKAAELEEHEKTLYYERMMFCYLLPEYSQRIGDQEVSMVVGGIKAYNKDNMTKQSMQSFQFFTGWQVKVCTNMCIWTDGTNLEIKADTVQALKSQLTFQVPEVSLMSDWRNVGLAEQEFAHLIGKAKMASYKEEHSLGLTDTQLNSVVKGYYENEHFSGGESIDLWSLYNLLTEANKSSYIDTFGFRAMECSSFVESLHSDLTLGNKNWHLWKS